MRHTALKFCGFTQATPIAQAIALGVEAIGLVFYPPSPRAVTPEQASDLVKVIPPFVTVVALVVNMGELDLQNLAKNVAFDVIQFHGDETAKQCQNLAKLVQKRWYKALRVKDSDTTASLNAQIDELKTCGASAVLLDAYHADKFGGTGEQFDWDKIPKNASLPIILAGGLTADNVGEAIQQTGVYGVDVSGAIERAKGQKDLAKMQEFVISVKTKDITKLTDKEILAKVM